MTAEVIFILFDPEKKQSLRIGEFYRGAFLACPNLKYIGVMADFAGDVLAVEPQSRDCVLIGAKNCILTPHIAWAPKETRACLIGNLRDNLAAFLRGEVQNKVN